MSGYEFFLDGPITCNGCNGRRGDLEFDFPMLPVEGCGCGVRATLRASLLTSVLGDGYTPTPETYGPDDVVTIRFIENGRRAVTVPVERQYVLSVELRPLDGFGNVVGPGADENVVMGFDLDFGEERGSLDFVVGEEGPCPLEDYLGSESPVFDQDGKFLLVTDGNLAQLVRVRLVVRESD